MSRDRVAAATLLLFGLGGVLEARRLTIGDPSRPGPGFFPFWLALALSLVAVALLLRRGPARPDPEAGAPADLRRPAKVVLAMVAAVGYTFALEPLGFVVSTLLFLLVLLRAIETRPWMASLTISALTALASHLVFKVWLAVQLPAGPWGF